jgi:hypothetical protein
MRDGRKGSGKGGKGMRNNKDKAGGRGGQMQAPPGYQGGFQGNRNQNQGGFQGNNNQGMPPGMTTQQMFNQYLHDSVQQGVPNLFENMHQGQAYAQPQMVQQGQQQMVQQPQSNIFNQGQAQNP